MPLFTGTIGDTPESPRELPLMSLREVVMFPHAIIPLFVGIGTHLFLDAMTPMGVPLLPNIKLHLGNIRTGSGVEHAIYSLLIVAGFGISVWAAVSRGLL